MNEQAQLIFETTDRMLRDLCPQQRVEASERGEFAGELWQTLETNGLTLACVGEASGGAGGSLEDSMAVIRCAARHAAPLPLLETLAFGLLREASGQQAGAGPSALHIDHAGAFRLDPSTGRLSGEATAVPWVPCCARLGILTAGQLVTLDSSRMALEPGVNIAGEPTAGLRCRDVEVESARPLPATWSAARAAEFMALGRAVMLAGALESALDLTLRYATERVQFGKTLSKFQAIQLDLAVLAGQVAAARIAGDGAISAWGEADASLQVAVAKARAGEAAGLAAQIAHQVHGAIGYTREYQLNLLTRRLWAWRDQDGSETRWRQQIGLALCAAGPDRLWQRMIGG